MDMNIWLVMSLLTPLVAIIVVGVTGVIALLKM